MREQNTKRKVLGNILEEERERERDKESCYLNMSLACFEVRDRWQP